MEVLIFIPIDDTPTWYSKETSTTIRGRFFLYRHNLSLYLMDTLEKKVRMFSFLFDLYTWLEQKWKYPIVFAQQQEQIEQGERNDI